MTTLVDRHEERAAIGRLIAAVGAGESQVLVLHGSAGVGKSALLDYAQQNAAGFRVLWVGGTESEMELAFAALHQLCRPLLDRLPDLPVPRREALETAFAMRVGAPPDLFLVGLAVLELLSYASESRPLLCVIDDTQWLDRASAQIFGFVARRLLAEPVGVLFGTRVPGPEIHGLTGLEVTRLRDDDAHVLLDSVTHGSLDRGIRDRIVAESQGNPLALIELPQGLSRTQLAGGLGLLTADSLPGRIEQSFLNRVRELPDPSRRLLLIAAAEPVGDPDLVLRAAERLGVPVATADTHGLLSLAERVTFRHPLVRSAVYRAAEPGDRRAAHLALAEATDRPDAVDRRAWHLAAAAAAPDEQVATELERSAAQAQARGGLAAAAAFLRRAVDLTADPHRRTDRLLAAAEACLPAGDLDEVRRLLVILGEQPLDALAAGRAMALQGQVAFASGHVREATELLLASAQRLATVDDQLARDAFMSAWGVAISVSRPESLRAVSLAARALPAPSRPRPIDLLLDGLTLLVTEGRAVAAAALHKAAQVLMDIRVDDVVKWGWVATGAAGAIWDDDAMRAMYARQARVVREAGALTDLPYHLASLCLITSWSGDFQAATALMAEADTVSQAIGNSMPPYARLRLLSLQGREAEATQIIGPTITSSAAAGFGMGVVAANWAAAVLYNGLARYPETLRAIESNGDFSDPTISTWVLPELVEAAVRVGDTERALDARSRAETCGRAGRRPGADRSGASDRRTRPGRLDQPGGRGAIVSQPAHRRVASDQGVREARRHLPAAVARRVAARGQLDKCMSNSCILSSMTDSSMTRVRLTSPGGPEVLVTETASLPSPGRGQVLIRAEAAGVAFHDISTRRGLSPGRLPDVLGFDVVGHVVELGPQVTGLAVGDRVGALVGTGGYATHVLAPVAQIAPMPDGPAAAVLDALLLNYLTAWQMFHRVAKPRPGDSVLVLGAAGGVGSALTQIARAAGVAAYGTSGPARRERVASLGATWVADATAVPVPVAATFDPVGGPSLAVSRRATAPDGVVVSYGFSFAADAGYSKAGALARTLAALARAKLTPGPRVAVHTVLSVVRKDPAGFRADIAALIGLLADGGIAPEVTTLPLAEAAEAHRRLEGREVEGKLVLLP